MTAPASERRLLVVSEPAPWIPADGHCIGAWVLRVVRCNGLHEVPPAQPDRPWDVIAFASTALKPLAPPAIMEALRRVGPEATFLPVASDPDPREALFFLKHGAFEYLEPPLAHDDFLRALSEAIENRDTFQEILDLNRTLEAQKEQLLREKVELERKNRELEALSRLARALAATIELEEVITHLTRSILGTVDCARLMIGTVDPDVPCEQTQVSLIANGDQLVSTDEKVRWHLNESEHNCWMHTVFREGRPLLVDDPRLHPCSAGTALADLHRNPFVKIPIATRGRVVGTITVESRHPDHKLSEEDLDLLGIYADTAAMALENARLYHSMRELSVRDELTGLYNRRHLIQQFEAECIEAERRNTPLSVLILDIDHFKQLNDGNNHLVGDAALRKLATTLLRNTRGIDTVARYGGEEFVILLPRTERLAAQLVAEKLRQITEDTAFTGESVLPSGTLTVSVGIAVYPSDASTRKELLERADWAMYQAKKEGRNRVRLWESQSAADAKANAVNYGDRSN